MVFRWNFTRLLSNGKNVQMGIKKIFALCGDLFRRDKFILPRPNRVNKVYITNILFKMEVCGALGASASLRVSAAS